MVRLNAHMLSLVYEWKLKRVVFKCSWIMDRGRSVFFIIILLSEKKDAYQRESLIIGRKKNVGSSCSNRIAKHIVSEGSLCCALLLLHNFNIRNEWRLDRIYGATPLKCGEFHWTHIEQVKFLCIHEKKTYLGRFT